MGLSSPLPDKAQLKPPLLLWLRLPLLLRCVCRRLPLLLRRLRLLRWRRLPPLLRLLRRRFWRRLPPLLRRLRLLRWLRLLRRLRRLRNLRYFRAHRLLLRDRRRFAHHLERLARKARLPLELDPLPKTRLPMDFNPLPTALANALTERLTDLNIVDFFLRRLLRLRRLRLLRRRRLPLLLRRFWRRLPLLLRRFWRRLPPLLRRLRLLRWLRVLRRLRRLRKLRYFRAHRLLLRGRRRFAHHLERLARKARLPLELDPLPTALADALTEWNIVVCLDESRATGSCLCTAVIFGS